MTFLLNRYNIVKYLIMLSITTSFITHILDFKYFFFFKFLTISEVFGMLAILFYLLFSNFNQLFKKTPKVFIYLLFLIIIFSIGLIITNQFRETLLSLAILFYLFLYCFVIYDTFKTDYLSIVKTLILTLIIMSLLGFFDFVAMKCGFFKIFPSQEYTYLISGFRYFGQAGDYAFIMLSFFIPFQFSNLSKDLTSKWHIGLRIATFLTLLILIGTGRISAIISIFIGFFLWIIMVKNFRIIKKHTIEIAFLLAISCLIVLLFPEFLESIFSRFDSRITNRVNGTLSADFIVDNFSFALQSFYDKPLIGHGLQSLINPKNNHEIHGTYLKILAETGILGFGFYVLFIASIVITIFTKNNKLIFKANDFFNNYFPFFVSSLVMWSYCYHLRKKEFYIILGLLLIISKFKTKELDNRI